MRKRNQNSDIGEISVIICDGQPLFRLGLRVVIEQQEGFHIVGEASDANELLKILARSVPKILILDMSIARQENFQLLRQIRTLYPAVKIVLTVPRSVHPIELANAIQVGAGAFILRDSQPNLVKMALQSVMLGKPWLQREFSEHIFHLLNSLPVSDELIRSLTEKEKQILILVAKGMSNKEIAQQLGLSLQTVKTHVSRILQKLKVRTRVEAARYTLALLRSSLDGQKATIPVKSR
ncbi:MAG: response regulator transcription factor [Armatimonadetes bacterium]|nr:response regulator transcription factor [Armatimonadota bacterium]